MAPRAFHRLSLLMILVGLCCAPVQAEKAIRNWGQGRSGLQLSELMLHPVGQMGTVKIHPAIRNAGTIAVNLPKAEKLTCFLTILRSRTEGLVTAPIALEVKGDWPGSIGPGETIEFEPVDLSETPVFGPGRQDVLAAMEAMVKDLDEKLPKAAGALADELEPGPAKAVLSLYIRRTGAPVIRLQSAPQDLDIVPPNLHNVPEPKRKAYLDALIQQFDRDAWSARAAHRIAVKLGPPAVPALIEAAGQKHRPRHSRMWLTTALADIPDHRGAAALVKLLKDPSPAVGLVICYHGPKQERENLDAAIVAAATAEQAPARQTALALLGYLVHRKDVPEKLLTVGLTSGDPRARSTAVEALKSHASESAVAALVGRLEDREPRIRALAAEALEAMNTDPVRTWPVASALVAALEKPGEQARKQISRTLSTITGNDILYVPDAPRAGRDKASAAWKDWLAKNRPR